LVRAGSKPKIGQLTVWRLVTFLTGGGFCGSNFSIASWLWTSPGRFSTS